MIDIKKNIYIIIKKIFKKILTLTVKIGGEKKASLVFKNMGILATGSVISKIIGFATYPIITRIYSPADFGIYAVYTSAIFILLPFATLRYTIAIPLPRNDILAFNILAMGFIIVIIFSSVLSIFFIISDTYIFELFNIDELAPYWWLLVIGIIGAALYDMFTDWATRKKKFAPVAHTDIWRSTISAILKIILGIIGYKPIGLLLGDTAHKTGGSLYLIKSFYKDIMLYSSSLSRRYIVFLSKYYRNLPLYHMPSDFLLVLTSKMPILFFAYQFGVEDSGQLGLSIMIVSVPMGLIGKSTSKAYYAEIAKIGITDKKNFIKITKSVIKNLSLLSIFTFGILLVSPTIFKFVFGEAWIQAGEFTRILSVYILFEFVTAPLVNIFNVYNKQSKLLKTSIMRILLIMCAFYISYIMNFDVYQTLYIYTTFMCIYFIYLGYSLYNIIK